MLLTMPRNKGVDVSDVSNYVNKRKVFNRVLMEGVEEYLLKQLLN